MIWTRVGCFQHGGQEPGSNMCRHKNFKGSDSSEASTLFLFCGTDQLAADSLEECSVLNVTLLVGPTAF